ncbi:MAG: glycosyltransferase [Armatimonadetes bacterium]|nr:glycosyltransferase [Armatimonadota bacterium]
MTIGMISNSWRPVRCGVTTVLEEAALHLGARGHRVVFIAPHHPGVVDAEWPTLRLPSVPLQSDYRVLAPWLPALSATWRALRRLDLDLVHAHDSVPFGAGFLGVSVRRRLGVPLVVTQHCFYESLVVDHIRAWPGGRRLAPLARVPMRACMRRVLTAADLVLAPSEAAARDVRRFRPEGVAVLPSGVAAPATHPNGEVRHRLGLSDQTRLLLNVGRQHADKNLLLLLEAFAHASHRMPDTVLVLVGEGPMRARLERRARELGADGRARFIGPVPHPEIWPWYAAADLLVSTSMRETQGLVFLEAMHMGLPVVAIEGEGGGSVVRHEDNGLLVPPVASAISDAIARCLTDPDLRARMSRQARAEALRFDSRALVAELEAHYGRVLAQSPPRRVQVS